MGASKIRAGYRASSTMKVIHVIPTLSSRNGGPVTAVLGMTSALAKAGVQVKVLTTDYRGNGASKSFACEVKTFHCVSDAWQWAPSWGRAMAAEIRWADVVTIHTLWTYPVASAARACFAAGIPYILRPAGMLDEWSLSQKSLKKKVYASLIENRTINRATRLWFTSEEERVGAKSFNYQTDDFVIPLGVPLGEYRQLPPKATFRAKFLNSSEGRIILFLGRITPKKQPDLLLSAFACLASEFPDTILVISGPDERDYANDLKKLATTLGIHDRVYFTGDLQKDDVITALNDAEVFVLPSLHENFGVAVIEAMASGTPVIVSERVGLAKVVSDSKAGIVIEPEAEDLKMSIRQILTNPEAAGEMGRSGRQTALDGFTWDKIIPGLIDEYLRALKESPVRRNDR